jgi:hypothetical protein
VSSLAPRPASAVAVPGGVDADAVDEDDILKVWYIDSAGEPMASAPSTSSSAAGSAAGAGTNDDSGSDISLSH